MLSLQQISALLADIPWQVRLMDETDSTNNALKRELDAPDGTALLARRQTGGRGRLGRSFSSEEGGVYLSILLRPNVPPEKLLHLTPMTAVAIRRAILDVTGVSAQIKWPNDLLCDEKKLCGILTELLGDAVIIGVGVNANIADFPDELGNIATSLLLLTGKSVDLNALAAAMIRRLYELRGAILTKKQAWLDEFAAHCVTLNKSVLLLRGEERRGAFAEGIDKNGALLVRFPNGETAAIAAGEVSVRGING